MSRISGVRPSTTRSGATSAMSAFWSRCMRSRYCDAIVSSGELREAAIRKRPDAKARTRQRGGAAARASRQ
jgi:hypothetical protein